VRKKERGGEGMRKLFGRRMKGETKNSLVSPRAQKGEGDGNILWGPFLTHVTKKYVIQMV